MDLFAQKAPEQLFKTAAAQPGFLRNLGQVRDLHNNPVEMVYYQANLGGQQVFLTRYGLSFLVSKIKKVRYESGKDSVPIVHYEMERIDIVLKQATILPDSILATASGSSTVFNFYMASSGSHQPALQLQRELLVKSVYPNIDWKIYIRETPGQAPTLKYDFIIHPGGDPAQIQLQYSGNARLDLAANQVSVKARMGLIREDAPYSYLAENQAPVAAAWRLKKNTLGFRVDQYDRRQTLVIDPSIYWLTYMSSTSMVWNYESIKGNDIETDAAGNIFVQLSAGYSSPFPTVNPGGGAYYQEAAASPRGAMIICKFSPGGQMLWSTYFGDCVRGNVMTRDIAGNIYAIGSIYDGLPADPNPPRTIPLLNNGGFYIGQQMKYFITKFSNSGTLLWSSYYCGASSFVTDMTYDTKGNIYVAGYGQSHDFPTVDPGGGAYTVINSPYGFAESIFVSQFDPANQLIWSTRVEGGEDDFATRICVDLAGNIYLGASTRTTNYPLVDAGGYFNQTAWGAYLIRFNAARKITWSTYIPATFRFSDLTTDNNNNLYLVTYNDIYKFDINTQLVFKKTVATTRAHFWEKIVYDARNDQLQMLGVMNDTYDGFPTQNTACDGSFFSDGKNLQFYYNVTGPIFATLTTDGDFSYLSFADWPYEYYNVNELTVDPKGDMIYLFGNQQNGYTVPNPQLTDPGNGAYFETHCCYLSNQNMSALLLKLTNEDLALDLQTTPGTGCNCNGKATVLPKCGKPDFTYLWSNGATTATVDNFCPGKQWVKVKDANGLTKTVYFDMPYPPGSISGLTKTVVDENCDRANGSILIQSLQGGTAPYSYSMDGVNYSGVPKIGGLAAGTYVVQVRDANGCIFKDTSVLARVEGPTSLEITAQLAGCASANGALTVTAVTGGIGPYTYSLDGGNANTSGQFSNLAAGSYQLTVADTAGCAITRSVVVDKAAGPATMQVTGNDDHCDQSVGNILVTGITGGTAPYTYSLDSISFGAAPPQQLAAGNYYLYVRDANGCMLKSSSIVIANEAGPLTMTPQVSPAYCGKTSGEIEIKAIQGGVGPYTYALDGGAALTIGVFTNVLPGSHQVTIKDRYGCALSQELLLDFKAASPFELTPKDTTVCYGAQVPLHLNGDPATLQQISWSVPATGFTPTVLINAEQTIRVTATDADQCIYSSTAVVKVKACNPPEKCLAIPNAFTPNKDGRNDNIRPLINGCRIIAMRFRIYNRFGELVFETERFDEGWNGSVNGAQQDPGVYVYTCDYTTGDQQKLQQKGTIILIR